MQNVELQIIADDIRRDAMKMIYNAGMGHISSTLSVVEILTALYFSGVLNYNVHNDKDPDRDKVVVSKGHACAAVYSTLAKAGYLEEKELNDFCKIGSRLGRIISERIPGVEATTGSLGQGICYATGLAIGDRIRNINSKTYAIIGDGEQQEGSVWEAALFAAHHKLNNLMVIIDRNKMQIMGKTKDVIDIEPLRDKWSSFGWETFEVDGHAPTDIANLLRRINVSNLKKPQLVIANTIKGKGVSFMENDAYWHWGFPTEEQWLEVFKELKIESTVF